MQTRARTLRLGLGLVAALVVGGGGTTGVPAQASAFAERIASLSEPGGYFDTDNLISNERSFLSVVPELRAAGVRGGAYLGVGPDQNFSYIAAIRPTIAVLIDIRRDNLLLHLLFKALFAESRTRVDYLAQLCGRSVPTASAVDAWRTRSIDEIAHYVDQSRPSPAGLAGLRARLIRRIQATGVPLSSADLATIQRFHSRFIEDGLDLQFQSTGRAPQLGYPTLRELVLGTDDTGRRAGYLADENAFLFVKSMQARDLIIPVVDDLGGPSAVGAVGRFLESIDTRVSALYASNVEFYLRRNGGFPQFVSNVRRLPWAANGVIIRSRFGGGTSDSLTEPAARFLAGP